jgi:hypothetical protein
MMPPLAAIDQVYARMNSRKNLLSLGWIFLLRRVSNDPRSRTYLTEALDWYCQLVRRSEAYC